MDKDRVVGSAKQVKGAVKQAIGKAVGDTKLESEGQADKVEGKIQNAIGGVKDTVKDALKGNRRCEWELLPLTSFVIRSTGETGRVIHPRATVMVFETVEISSSVEERREESPLVSWAAIIAGAIAAAALTLVLLAFGAGMGFSAVSPWGNSGVSASTFQIGTGIYLIVVAMLASTVGGFIAGRLRTKWVGVHTHEVFFRDTAHGFLAWGLATVLSAAFLASAASNIAGVASSAPASGGPVDYYVDALLRSNPAASQNTTDMEATRREIARMLVTGFRSGDVPASDRTYLAQVVAVRTGLSQEDADKRVSDVFNQAKTALDNARRAAAKLSLWLTASLLIGAFCASLGATEGGYVRDNWNPNRTVR